MGDDEGWLRLAISCVGWRGRDRGSVREDRDPAGVDSTRDQDLHALPAHHDQVVRPPRRYALQPPRNAQGRMTTTEPESRRRQLGDELEHLQDDARLSESRD